MAIGPRRPVTPEFLEFEKYAMERATDVYGYVWQTGAEVNFKSNAEFIKSIVLTCFMVEMLSILSGVPMSDLIIQGIRNKE